MSSSDRGGKNGSAPAGRIIMGLQSRSLSEGNIAVWTEEAEAELLNRVRSKARLQAKEIISKAMAEAEQIKARIREEVYQECLEQVRGEVARSHAQLCETAHRMFSTLQDEQQNIFEQYRDELVELVRVCVEKGLRLELDHDRRSCLAALLEEGLELIDSHRELTLTVCPQDGEQLEELLKALKENFPSLEKWRIKTRPGLEPGGVILESSYGLVDNSVKGRLESVREVLEHLALGDEQE